MSNAVLLTVPETAALLRQHRATVYRKIRRGELPAIRLGGDTAALRVPEDALRIWLTPRNEPRDN